jgi:hypothetical protein
VHTGTLGHNLPIAPGLAEAGRRQDNENVLMEYPAKNAEELMKIMKLVILKIAQFGLVGINGHLAPSLVDAGLCQDKGSAPFQALVMEKMKMLFYVKATPLVVSNLILCNMTLYNCFISAKVILC